MVQHMLAELHDFRGADGVETSDWVLQVCVTYVMVLRGLCYLCDGRLGAAGLCYLCDGVETSDWVPQVSPCVVVSMFRGWSGSDGAKSER